MSHPKQLKKIDENIWELPKTDNMKVPGKIYANQKIKNSLQNDNALEQVRNVATLPGIQKYSIAMPDIHWGYGFPIGGVAAMDIENGVISPGGVGYDINCGVRFIRTNLKYNDIKNKIRGLTENIFKVVPTGVGSQNAIPTLNRSEIKNVLKDGAKWAIQNGYGFEKDMESIEEFGRMKQADPEKISNKAIKRCLNQVGTLGSGNHFIELGKVRNVFDNKFAEKMGLFENQFIIILHTGSRGLGHQVCDDYVHEMLLKSKNLDFELADRQLASAYINSELGKNYFSAMSCAANYAWANRQVIMSLVQKAVEDTLKIKKDDLGYQLIYDVCHNIAKIEDHEVDGKIKQLCVHRKGATRAFGPGRKELSSKYLEIGQPVIIPGDMGTESYLCLGTEKAMTDTFGSSCHGAGRVMSRRKALKTTKYNEVVEKMKKKHIFFQAASKKTLIEEMSSAYKNVSDVVQTMHDAKIINKVVRTVPLGVVKG